METNFESCLAFTRGEEGGYVDDPRDSGNWTSGRVGQGRLIGSNMGVGAPALLDWMGAGATIRSEQMRQLPLSTYESIARCRYWIPIGCTSMPSGLDLIAFDFGWNRGPGTSLTLLTDCLASVPGRGVLQAGGSLAAAINEVPTRVLLGRVSTGGVKLLQQRMGVASDGIIGVQTARAFEGRNDLRVMAVILAMSAAQIASYRRLGNFSIYGAGWLARTARRQAAALALIATQTTASVLEACA